LAWPWVATFALATTLALALDHGITGAQVEPIQPGHGALTTLPTPSTHTIILTSTDAQGATQSLSCQAPMNLFASDELQVSPVDLDRLSTQLQCDDARSP
jgi:hypothetical protein